MKSKSQKPTKLFKFLRNWKIRSQILFTQSIAFLIILFILIGLIFYTSNYINNHIANEAQNIMIQKIIITNQNLMLNHFAFRINSDLRKNENKIQVIDKLYKFVSANQVQFQTDVPQCLQDQNISISFYTNVFCYGIFNHHNNANHEAIQLSNILTQTLPIQGVNISNLYFTTTTDEEYFSISPGNYFQGYHPHQRQWYIDHVLKMNNTQQYQYSDPYLGFFNSIYLTATTNISYQSKLFGVAAIDINTTQFQYLNSHPKIQSYLVDLEGRILVCEYYKLEQNKIQYFYNKSITGVDYDQFLEVMQFHRSNTQNSDFCMNMKDIMCIQDENRRLFIKTLNVSESELFAIITIDSTIFENEFQKLLDLLDQLIQANLQLLVILILGSVVVFIISQMISILFLQRPLERLKNQLQFADPVLEDYFYESDQIQQLGLAFLNLQGDKNLQLLEQLQFIYKMKHIMYPQRECFVQFNRKDLQKLFNISSRDSVVQTMLNVLNKEINKSKRMNKPYG